MEHNEPYSIMKLFEGLNDEVWGVVDKNRFVVLKFHESYGDFVNHAKDCVNACAGMSDKEVEIIQPELAILKNNLQAEEHIGEELRTFCLKSDEERASLHIKLDEAVGLLEAIYTGQYSHGNNPAMLLAIRDFLAKHKEAR